MMKCDFILRGLALCLFGVGKHFLLVVTDGRINGFKLAIRKLSDNVNASTHPEHPFLMHFPTSRSCEQNARWKDRAKQM